MFYLRTEEAFDAAHFLAGYTGKCRNIHGHRWRVVAELKGEELKTDLQERGMLMDFSEFKTKLEQVRQLVAELDSSLQTTRKQELDQIAAAFSKAEASRDPEGCAKAMESLRDLQKKVGLEGLAKLK